MSTDAVQTEAAPTTAPLDNSRAWLLTVAPLLILAIDAAFLYSGHSDSTIVSIGVALGVTVALAAWDSRYLRERGTPVPGMSTAWFVPGYLYARSKELGQSQAPLAVWIGTVVVAVAAGLALDAHFVTLDVPALQEQLGTWTDQQTNGSGASASCPSRTTYAVGSTFLCSVTDSTGSAHILVKVENGGGALTWQLIG